MQDKLVLNFTCYFDCSSWVEDGVFEVLSTSRDTHLGGDDFDKVGINFFSF